MEFLKQYFSTLSDPCFTLISMKVAQPPLIIFETQNKLTVMIKKPKSNGTDQLYF